MNIKFKRQVPIGVYIADFVCKDKKLIIELDGSGHLETAQQEHDINRDSYLKSQGYEILRFYNNDIENNLEEVLEVIRQKILSPMGREKNLLTNEMSLQIQERGLFLFYKPDFVVINVDNNFIAAFELLFKNLF